MRKSIKKFNILEGSCPLFPCDGKHLTRRVKNGEQVRIVKYSILGCDERLFFLVDMIAFLHDKGSMKLNQVGDPNA